MSYNRILGLFLRHFYLIKSSFPRILDLIYWPTIQIILWGFISKFFTIYSDYYNNTVGVILSCAILYDFLLKIETSSKKEFNINEKLVFKYFDEFNHTRNDKYLNFEHYFSNFYNFCFELSPNNMIRDALKFKFNYGSS